MTRLLMLAAWWMMTSTLFAAGSKEYRPGFGDLRYNPSTGWIQLIPPPDGLVGFVLRRNPAAGQFRPISYKAFMAATPWDDLLLPDEQWGRSFIGSSDLTFRLWTVPITLGEVAPSGLNLDLLFAFLDIARYSPGLVRPPEEFNLVILPEPGSAPLALLGLASVLGYCRCRPDGRKRKQCRPVRSSA